MPHAYFITHPDVVIDPAVPVPRWPLSPRGLARMRRVLELPWARGLGAVYCSDEQKAMDGAAVLAAGLGLPYEVVAGLEENDRSATGYLPREEFEAVADAFFERPQESVRGWERAIDAQQRIVGAVAEVLARAPRNADLAIVSHGAVGALYLCHLKGCPISREEDQPPTNGGNHFAFDVRSGRLLHGWRSIDG